MKISIWQQFSSNHSAYFTIIGKFETVMDAKQAEAELHNMLKSIKDWYDENPEDAEKIYKGENPLATPPEIQLRQKYSVKWQYALPWFWNYKLSRYSDLVFITTDGQADGGAKPLDDVMRKLGGMVFVDGDVVWYEDYRKVFVDLSCVAADEPTVETIVQQKSGYFKVRREDLNLFFDRWDFLHIDEGIPDLIEYLKSQGCKDIEYRFTEVENYED